MKTCHRERLIKNKLVNWFLLVVVVYTGVQISHQVLSAGLCFFLGSIFHRLVARPQCYKVLISTPRTNSSNRLFWNSASMKWYISHSPLIIALRWAFLAFTLAILTPTILFVRAIPASLLPTYHFSCRATITLLYFRGARIINGSRSTFAYTPNTEKITRQLHHYKCDLCVRPANNIVILCRSRIIHHFIGYLYRSRSYYNSTIIKTWLLAACCSDSDNVVDQVSLSLVHV